MEEIHPPHTTQFIQVYPQTTTTEIQNPQIIHITHPTLPTTQGKVTYQQTIKSESIHIPTRNINSEQIVMSCHQQIHNIPLQGPITTQVVHSTDLGQSLHVIVPQVPMFKQHMIVNGVHQYFGQYEFPEEQCIVPKIKKEIQLKSEKEIKCRTEKDPLHIEVLNNKRTRNTTPNPSMWACNVRKEKHQRGEAYINRRGKYVPERQIKTTKDCTKTCKLKCSELINDSDREHIFKAFYTLNGSEKKHFLLNTTERNSVKVNHPYNQKRKYSFKYFFLVRSVKYTVCKNFYLGTLAISQKPVYNVHSGKSDMNIPKQDGRGLSEASSHTVPVEIKNKVRSQIMSFKTVDSKPIKQFSKKKQYLESSLTIKKMYTMYFNECNENGFVPVKESMYRKILKHEFNLHFKKNKEQFCGKCKISIKKEFK